LLLKFDNAPLHKSFLEKKEFFGYGYGGGGWTPPLPPYLSSDPRSRESNKLGMKMKRIGS
jgi:hypothetical protein